ncbi:hypothetical protein WJX81_000341 [Elliptochloris bilobata]|uniref:Uncharacterized protein n=1 Tax=Elliptochloris bilobata TaxID=381761 RepID=A0AAW1RQV0_9CHLO
MSSPAYTQAATPGRLSRLVACLDTGSDGAPVPRATAGAAAPGLLQLAPLDPSPGGPVRRGGAGGAAAASAAPAAAPAPAVDGSHVPRSGRASAAVRSLAAALIPTALMRGPAGGSRDASEDARMASARAKVRSVLMAAVTTGQLPRIPGIVSKSRKQANAAARKHLRALMEMGARGELDAYRRGIEQPVQQPLAPAAIGGGPSDWPEDPEAHPGWSQLAAAVRDRRPQRRPRSASGAQARQRQVLAKLATGLEELVEDSDEEGARLVQDVCRAAERAADPSLGALG